MVMTDDAVLRFHFCSGSFFQLFTHCAWNLFFLLLDVLLCFFFGSISVFFGSFFFSVHIKYSNYSNSFVSILSVIYSAHIFLFVIHKKHVIPVIVNTEQIHNAYSIE